MANIKLKGLFEAEDFKARSKETGKLVHFKSKDAYQAAIKAGSHEDPKAEKGGASKGATKPNSMFGGDYAKDRGGEAPKADTPKVNLPKKASELDDTHAESLEKAINAEVGLNGFVDTDDYTDAIIYTASTGNEPTYTLYFGSNSDYGKPDEFRVTFASTAIDNDPSNIGNKFDKSFKSAEDAMKYTIALAKKYKKELEMDDAAPKADTPKASSKKVSKSKASSDGQTDDELYDALYDMGYDFGELGSDDFDEEGFADAAMNLGYRWDDKNKVWNHRDKMGDAETSKSTQKINSKNWTPDEDDNMSNEASADVQKYLNSVLGADGSAEVDYNTGNIQYGLADSENSIFVGYADGKYNVSFEGPSMDLDKMNQSYKSFKNPKEALQYAGELAKANREGLEQKQESTKLTSMIKR